MKARICKTCSRGSCSYHSCGVLLKAVRSASDAVMEPSRVLRTAPASLGSESVGTLATKGPSLLFESRDMRPACRSAPESIILGGSKCPSPNNDLFSNIVLTSVLCVYLQLSSNGFFSHLFFSVCFSFLFPSV